MVLADDGSPDTDATLVAAFRQGLKESGFVESQNVAIEYRWANGENDRLPALAADLVRRQVSVIASSGGVPAALAAKAATKAIPVVFFTGGDPVGLGIVDSLRRPGGNLTGVTTPGDEVGPKRLELMRQLLLTTSALGLLVNPTTVNSEAQLRIMRPAAPALGFSRS
jgi:putative tryptophan/tyrosine transport system substrate-binding protein